MMPIYPIICKYYFSNYFNVNVIDKYKENAWQRSLMAVPTNRSEFKEFCLRKLGKPVIEINIDDDQVDDRIDEAIRYYWDYHFDGADKIYYKYHVTAQDKTNRYITMPDNIIKTASQIFFIIPQRRKGTTPPVKHGAGNVGHCEGN